MNGFGLILWIVKGFLGSFLYGANFINGGITAGLREACRLGHCEDQEQTLKERQDKC